MPIQYLSTMEEYNSLLETSKSKLVVMDFSATWCGPCRFIAPIYHKIAEETPEVAFAAFDVDEAEEVAALCEINAMPTFQFYKDGKKIDEMKGADHYKLEELIAEHK